MARKKEKVVTLDLTGCKNWLELHERIRIAFDFPDFYGKNWDAFWDLIRTECDADRIVVIGEDTLPKDLERDREKVNEILYRFRDHWAQYHDKIIIEIQ
ncbi:MAG TPA: barstar family protein [Candidatus Onthovicinus excrementipullorum]|nr:barstar family protein [Candidatus Onthovicinus excrementipullorum]